MFRNTTKFVINNHDSYLLRMCRKRMTFRSRPIILLFQVSACTNLSSVSRDLALPHTLSSPFCLYIHTATHYLCNISSHHVLIICQPTAFWWQITAYIFLFFTQYPQCTALIYMHPIRPCHMNYICSCPSSITKLVSFSLSSSFLSPYYRHLTELERSCCLIDSCCDVQSALNFRYLIPIRP